MNDEHRHLARRLVVVNSLAHGGMDLETAEGWCDRWEVEAAREGVLPSERFWDEGRRWIDRHRMAGTLSDRAPAAS